MENCYLVVSCADTKDVILFGRELPNNLFVWEFPFSKSNFFIEQQEKLKSFSLSPEQSRDLVMGALLVFKNVFFSERFYKKIPGSADFTITIQEVQESLLIDDTTGILVRRVNLHFNTEKEFLKFVYNYTTTASNFCAENLVEGTYGSLLKFAMLNYARIKVIVKKPLVENFLKINLLTSSLIHKFIPIFLKDRELERKVAGLHNRKIVRSFIQYNFSDKIFGTFPFVRKDESV